MRPSGPLDLTLHGLPAGEPGGGGILVPEGAGASGRLIGASGGTGGGRGWRPRGDAGDPILGKVEEVKSERFPLQSLGREGYLYEGPRFSAHVTPEGEVRFDDKNIGFNRGTSSGSFDVTDLLMKGKGEDSRRYEKQKFLEATADLRAELARKARAERTREALAGLPSHLASVWGDRRRPARERRRLLFALWKEADDEGGREARVIIESFIRQRLPEGSDEAYSTDELDAYSRAGRQPFQPYK
jgi:hypothetical protein